MTDTPKKVLIVEDEKDLRETLEEELTKQGFTIASAQDGHEGLNTAREFRPHVILLDIILPKQNGIDMLRELRKEEWGKNIHVIVMTVLDDMEKISEALEAGALEYVVKTHLSVEDMIGKVKSKFQ